MPPNVHRTLLIIDSYTANFSSVQVYSKGSTNAAAVYTLETFRCRTRGQENKKKRSTRRKRELLSLTQTEKEIERESNEIASRHRRTHTHTRQSDVRIDIHTSSTYNIYICTQGEPPVMEKERKRKNSKV